MVFTVISVSLIVVSVVAWAYVPQLHQWFSTDNQNSNTPKQEAQVNSIAPVSEPERVQIFSRFSPSFTQSPLSFPDYTIRDGTYWGIYGAEYISKTYQGKDWASVAAASTQDSSTIFQAVNSMANNPSRYVSDRGSDFADQIYARNLVRDIMAARPKLIDAPYGPILFGSGSIPGPSAVWISVDKITGKPILIFVDFYPYAYSHFEDKDRAKILSGEDTQNLNAILQSEIIKTYYEKYPPDLPLTKQLEQTLQNVYAQNNSHAFRITLDSEDFSAFSSYYLRESDSGGSKFDFAYYIDEPNMSHACDWYVFYPNQGDNDSHCEAIITSANGKVTMIKDSSLAEAGGYPQKWLDDNMLFFSAELAESELGGDTQGIQGTFDINFGRTTRLMKYLLPYRTSAGYQIEVSGKKFLFAESGQKVSVYLIPDTFVDFLKTAFDTKNISTLQETGSFDLVQGSYVWLELESNGNLQVLVGKRAAYGESESDEIQTAYELSADNGTIKILKTNQ